jgi:hypothetical protein
VQPFAYLRGGILAGANSRAETAQLASLRLERLTRALGTLERGLEPARKASVWR